MGFRNFLTQIIIKNFNTIILLMSIALLFIIIFYIFAQLKKFHKDDDNNIKMNFQLSNFYYKVSYLIFMIIGILLTMFAVSSWF